MTLVSKLLERTKSRMIPSNTTVVKGLEIQPWIELREMYNNSDTKIQLVSTLLNSLYTGNLPCFVLTKRIMEGIVERDRNIRRKTINPGEYKWIVKTIIETGLVGVVVKGSSFGKGRKAGLYRVLDKELRGKFSNIETREEEIVTEYCNMQRIEKVKLDAFIST